jgi:hypothetical protein
MGMCVPLRPPAAEPELISVGDSRPLASRVRAALVTVLAAGRLETYPSYFHVEVEAAEGYEVGLYDGELRRLLSFPVPYEFPEQVRVSVVAHGERQVVPARWTCYPDGRYRLDAEWHGFHLRDYKSREEMDDLRAQPYLEFIGLATSKPHEPISGVDPRPGADLDRHAHRHRAPRPRRM